MSNQQLKKRAEGFTIIEVLIVLAIAALIMLIVFLAVPALRRNQQNTAMRNEASRILSGATEYESNANGAQVDSQAKVDSIFTNAGTLTQLTGAHTYQSTSQNGVLAAGASQLGLGTCSGTDGSFTGSGRTYAIRFGLQGGQVACIQS